MSDSRQIRSLRGEGQECLRALLANQHCHVPTFVLRSDQECSALSNEYQIAPGRSKVRERVIDVALERLGTTNWGRWGQVRCRRIICDLTKPKQIQHDDLTGDVPHHERAPGLLRRLQISGLLDAVPIRCRSPRCPLCHINNQRDQVAVGGRRKQARLRGRAHHLAIRQPIPEGVAHLPRTARARLPQSRACLQRWPT